MTSTPELKELIHQNASEAQLRQKAIDSGMCTLAKDSERWVSAKMTTLAEIRRVTGMDHLDI